MRMFPKVSIVACALALLIATPAGALAQGSSASTTVSIEIVQAPELLTIAATYTPGTVPVTTEGGDATGQLEVAVNDTRPDTQGWNASATMGPFMLNGQAVPGLASTFLQITFVSKTSVDIRANPGATLNAPDIGIMFTPVRASGVVTWSTRLAVPAGLLPGTYSAVLTLDIIAMDPF